MNPEVDDAGASRLVTHNRESVMGTVVTIDVYATQVTGGPQVSVGAAQARAALRRADAVFSTWKADSPMSRLRRGEISCAEAPPEVRDVLELCATAHELSGGWFDPWAMPGGVDPTGYVKGWAARARPRRTRLGRRVRRLGERRRRRGELRRA